VVKKFVKPLRDAFRRNAETTLRFKTAPGQQGQADWGSIFVWFGEKRVRIRFFALALGYSRRMFSRAYQNERLINLLAGHEAAFARFGGRPREILYDNPKTMVKGRDPDSEKIELNPTFRLQGLQDDSLRQFGNHYCSFGQCDFSSVMARSMFAFRAGFPEELLINHRGGAR
jgi:transposase